MGRDYGKVAPSFWTGETGRQLREAGPEVQLIALYLLTCQSAHMTGLFYLPLPTLCHETGLTKKGACKALARVSKVNFAHYDEASEVVWVPEMAHFQVGESLVEKDNRHKGIVKYLETYRKSKYFNDFYDRYQIPYHLPALSPLQAPCKGRVRARAEQEQEQEQEQDTISSEPQAAAEQFILTFPVVGKDGNTWGLTQTLADKLAAAFPGVDVPGECCKALVWCEANPTKQKTPRGMGRFLFSWMDRSQNRGGRTANPEPEQHQLPYLKDLP